MNGLGKNIKMFNNCNCAHVRPKTLYKMIDAALKELHNTYIFDTKANLVSQYEVYEDLAFASRRQYVPIPIPIDSYCVQHPDALECRVYDL